MRGSTLILAGLAGQRLRWTVGAGLLDGITMSRVQNLLGQRDGRHSAVHGAGMLHIHTDTQAQTYTQFWSMVQNFDIRAAMISLKILFIFIINNCWESFVVDFLFT